MKTSHIQLFKDARGRWRWRLRAPNGRIVATAGEAFSSKLAARRAAVALPAHARQGAQDIRTQRTIRRSHGQTKGK